MINCQTIQVFGEFVLTPFSPRSKDLVCITSFLQVLRLPIARMHVPKCGMVSRLPMVSGRRDNSDFDVHWQRMCGHFTSRRVEGHKGAEYGPRAEVVVVAMS